MEDRWTAALRSLVGAFAVCAATLAGCTQQMAEQPRCGPREASTELGGWRGERHPGEGRVARGEHALEVPV
jgi:hypothetical protein